MTLGDEDKITYSYDALKRLSGTTVKNSGGTTVLTHAYAYKNLGTTNGITQTTTQVEYHNVRNAMGVVISGAKYTYDAVGNIVGIYESEGLYRILVAYTYDAQNQLLSETYYTYSGDTTIPSDTTTYSYTYDSAGNLLTESKDGTITKTYTYGNSSWNDRLTKFNGTTITYDTIGNPISYYNANRWTLSWEQGRNLSSSVFSTGNGAQDPAQLVETETALSYTYDMDGIRTGKTQVFGIYRYQLVDGTYERMPITTTTTEHHYVTQNGKVVRETIGTGETAQVLDFIYDEGGKPFALIYTNGTADPVTYYYVLNLQGDVVKLVEHVRNGRVYTLNTVAEYTYDAWGKPLSTTDGEGNSVANTHIAKLNPLRYRGYYFDMETGFYYLQSRYYDPTLRRFINADSYQSTGQGILGTNMFVYCLNNPAVFLDSEGTDAIIVTNIGITGHLGILVEDEDGIWYHFYWGASDGDGSSGSSGSISPWGTGAKTWCEEYTGELNLASINTSEQYRGSYDSLIYLEGDFSSCLDEMHEPKGEYNLYSNNCAQKSLRILAQADTEYKDILEHASKCMHPNKARADVLFGITAKETKKKISRWWNKTVDYLDSLF